MNNENIEKWEKDFETDWVEIYNRKLIPAYQTLVPLGIKLGIRLTYMFARQKAQAEIDSLNERIKKLEFMIENGLGWEDMKTDGAIGD